MKRAAKIAAGVLAGWIVVLFFLGFALGSRQERKTTERIGESLQALVTIETSDLALIRGRWSFEKLAVRHDSLLGKLALDVGGVRCELGPLGWALVDRIFQDTAHIVGSGLPRQRNLCTDFPTEFRIFPMKVSVI